MRVRRFGFPPGLFFSRGLYSRPGLHAKGVFSLNKYALRSWAHSICDTSRTAGFLLAFYALENWYNGSYENKTSRLIFRHTLFLDNCWYRIFSQKRRFTNSSVNHDLFDFTSSVTHLFLLPVS